MVYSTVVPRCVPLPSHFRHQGPVAMAEFNLEEKFPNLRLIQSPPSLHTINGIGTTIYGARDHDPETGTYVKTHWFCVLFIPVLALGAYRVADAERGWYFIGKEPL